MKGYELSRYWFDFSFENPEAKTIHTAIFMWVVELNNRLGWKAQFGLPTRDTCEGLSIGNKTTYNTALKDLHSWGFITIIKESKNQYQSCIISINEKKCRVKNVSALDRALLRHCESTVGGTSAGTATIDKPINHETSKPINKEGPAHLSADPVKWWKTATKEILEKKCDPFKEFYPTSFIEYFVGYYMQDHEDGGSLLKYEQKFSVEFKLKAFWADPKTKAKYSQKTQLLPDGISTPANERLANAIQQHRIFNEALDRANENKGDYGAS